MKHTEIYDKHADRRSKKPKKKFTEANDRLARKQRVSFKNYVRELDEALLEEDLELEDDLDE